MRSAPSTVTFEIPTRRGQERASEAVRMAAAPGRILAGEHCSIALCSLSIDFRPVFPGKLRHQFTGDESVSMFAAPPSRRV